MNAEHPPAYVASVTYGRLVIFTFESTYSAEEMGAALDFAYSGGVDVSGNVSVTRARSSVTRSPRPSSMSTRPRARTSR